MKIQAYYMVMEKKKKLAYQRSNTNVREAIKQIKWM